jgi:hypothetical protein
MAEALTYDSLVSDIATYVERNDEPFVAQVPRFIMLAENRLASEVRGLGYKRVVSFTLNQGTAVVPKPVRWRETVTFSVAGDYLYNRSYDFCRSYWPALATTGDPMYYADYDYEHFLVVAPPAVDSPSEIVYFERPEPLSTVNQTNWTTQYAPQLLLYASLLEAQPFLKTSERMTEFNELYGRAIQAIQSEELRRKSLKE